MSSKKIKCPKCEKKNPLILNSSIKNNENINFLISCNCSNNPIECDLENFLKISNSNFKNLYENKLPQYKSVIERINSIENYFNIISESITKKIKIINDMLISLLEKFEKKKYEFSIILNKYALFINSLFNSEDNLVNIENINISDENISYSSLSQIITFLTNTINEINSKFENINSISFNQSLLFEFDNEKLYNKKEFIYHSLTVYDIIECISVNKIASCSSDHKLNLYNNDENLTLFKTIITGYINIKLYEIQKKQRIACTTITSKILIYSLITFENVLNISCHNNIIWDFIQLSNGKFVSCGADKNINIYNENLTSVKDCLKGHDYSIRHILEFKPNLLISCCWGGKIIFWDLIENKNIYEYNCGNCVYDMVKISENKLIVSIKLSKIGIFDIENKKMIKINYIQNSMKIWSICINNNKDQNNNLIYCACKSGRMIVLNYETLAIVNNIKIPSECPKKICMLSNGKILMTCRNGKIYLLTRKT